MSSSTQNEVVKYEQPYSKAALPVECDSQYTENIRRDHQNITIDTKVEFLLKCSFTLYIKAIYLCACKHVQSYFTDRGIPRA